MFRVLAVNSCLEKMIKVHISADKSQKGGVIGHELCVY